MPTNEHITYVLVTRPEHQSANLCEQLLAEGLQPIKHPTIEIQATQNNQRVNTELLNLGSKDFIIFVSSNAALKADALLKHQWPNIQGRIVAIGPTTAKVLKSIGLTAAITAAKPFNSEQLLQQVTSNLNNKSIAIIKGEGGRTLLAEQLKKRGANVSSIDVYKRVRPSHSQRIIDDLPHYITITSQLALENLFLLLPSKSNEFKQKSSFIVFSQRIATYAKKNGCKHIIVSNDASDAGLIEAIIKAEKC